MCDGIVTYSPSTAGYETLVSTLISRGAFKGVGRVVCLRTVIREVGISAKTAMPRLPQVLKMGMCLIPLTEPATHLPAAASLRFCFRCPSF